MCRQRISKVIFSVERDTSMQNIVHSAVAEILASAVVGASSPTQSTSPGSTIDTESAQVSITHLTFNRNIPLAREIEAYQASQQETETTAGRLQFGVVHDRTLGRRTFADIVAGNRAPLRSGRE